MKDLLPCAEDGLAVSKRNRQRRAEQGGLEMGVAIAIMPGLFVAVVAAWRDELVEDFGKIAFESRLEFDCADRSSAADGEDMDKTGADAGSGSNGVDFFGEVVHVSMAACREEDLLLVSHAKRIRQSGDRGVIRKPL